MLNNHLGPVLALVLVLLSTTAHAFIDLPYITPASPLAAQPITVNVRSGVCDAVLSEQVLSREGNAIHVVFFGVRYFNSELCTISPGLTDFVLGTYPVGTYTLQVDLEYYGVTGILVAETIGNVPFRVDATPTSAVPAPINEPIALLLLILIIIGLATCSLRARRPHPVGCAGRGMASCFSFAVQQRDQHEVERTPGSSCP